MVTAGPKITEARFQDQVIHLATLYGWRNMHVRRSRARHDQRARNAPAVPTGRVSGRVCDECARTYRARLKAERDLVAGELAALRHAQGDAA